MTRLTCTAQISFFLLIAVTASARAQQSPTPYDTLPYDTLNAYLKTLEDKDATPDLPIYTRATREWKKTWKVTPAQMANEARDIKRCGDGELKTSGHYAVIRYAPGQRECSPFFFEMEEGAWRLDFLTMSRALRFNQKNRWHLVLPEKHPYTFAFRDWRFDKNGYPHK